VPEPPAALDDVLAGQLRDYRERAATYTQTALVPIGDADYRRTMSANLRDRRQPRRVDHRPFLWSCLRWALLV
jgi:hypothetical protein